MTSQANCFFNLPEMTLYYFLAHYLIKLSCSVFFLNIKVLGQILEGISRPHSLNTIVWNKNNGMHTDRRIFSEHAQGAVLILWAPCLTIAAANGGLAAPIRAVLLANLSLLYLRSGILFHISVGNKTPSEKVKPFFEIPKKISKKS